MDTVIHNTIHVVLALTLPPLLVGVIAKTKALVAGRVGPPFFQLYFDLNKLFRKGSVFSTTTTWVFRAGPVVGLVTAAIAALLIPLTNSSAPVSFTGDLILLAYLLGLGRFFTASAALDTGSAFEGMGAAREVTFACLAEPAFFLGLLVLAKLSGSLQLADMLGGAVANWPTYGASLALVVLSWFIVLLAENSRIPFDDPNTHLELTMIHEVMVLDHSGPAYGMILYGAALKLFVFSAMVVRLVVPVSTGAAWLDWPVFVGAMLAVAVVVGVVESTMARLRLTQVPVLLVTACLLSAFGVILLVRVSNGVP
jgi:formate hydrogenlyase subunit 4